MPKSNYQTKGLTLIELITSLGVMVIVMIAAYTTYSVHQKAFKSGSDYLDWSQNGRIALDRMSREIRQTPIIITSLPSASSQSAVNEILFQDGHTANPIKYIGYYLDGTNLMRKVIHYYFPSEPDQWVPYGSHDAQGTPPLVAQDENQVIAESVTSLSFWGEKVIYIKINVGRSDKNLSLQTAVWGRNL